MIKNVFAPDLDALLRKAQAQPVVIDEVVKEKLRHLLEILNVLAICGEDECRELWLEADRGTIEDWGDYEESLSDNEVSNREEFEGLWRYYYPDASKWYKFTVCHYQENYFFFVDGKLTYHLKAEPEKEYGVDTAELLDWLTESSFHCIESLNLGFYNDYVRQHLPYRKRIGKIERSDYWNIIPEEKEWYLKKITPEEIKRFERFVLLQTDEKPQSRLQDMTAALFFHYCRLGYEPNGLCRPDDVRTDEELYRANADGRDGGLMELELNSPGAYQDWFDGHAYMIGHPWEVCRGGNSTHISLFVRRDERGWWLSLAGKSRARSVETIKFFLALCEHQIPVQLCDANELLGMVTGKDYIGIVPEGVTPRYCASFFPTEENIIDYMNLGDEQMEAIIEKADWYPLETLCFAVNPL